LDAFEDFMEGDLDALEESLRSSSESLFGDLEVFMEGDLLAFMEGDLDALEESLRRFCPFTRAWQEMRARIR
jgi:hypothetical protein